MDLSRRVETWRNAFEKDDNAITQTLGTYAWNHAAFSTAMTCIERAPLDESGIPRVNHLIFELLHQSYWAGAVMAIRRLVDTAALHGPRGVCSLVALINDAKGVKHQLTREWFLEVAGYRYDVAKTRAEAFSRRGAMWVGRADDYFGAEARHVVFDFLSGTASDDRQKDDLIRDAVFDALLLRTQKLKKIADHADVHFAHAATSISRAGRAVDKWGSAESTGALRILTETAELVGRWFLGSGVGGVLAYPQYDQFLHLDQPLANAETIQEVTERWEAFRDESASWNLINDADL